MSNAQNRDTLITSDGGPGPYSLGTAFIDISSVEITFCDSSYVPPWTFIESHNALLFSHPIDSGKTFRVHYATEFHGIPKIHSLFTKRHMTLEETQIDASDFHLSSPADEQYGNLSVSGYKSFGISIGSYGEVTLEQGLDVVAKGEVRPGTELSAHLTDQGSSLEGTTREISDFDMIYVELKNPTFSINLGDQFTHWPLQGIFSGTKKIKGLSASYSPNRAKIAAFGSLSGGSHTIQTIYGVNGIQGPYYLTGRGEAGIISPVDGTVKVRVNGMDLKEGRNADFTIDYDIGSVTFNPNVLIRDEDIIRIEYEYKTFDYRRSLVGTKASYFSPESTFSVKGSLWSESDNKDHPIELVLTPEHISALREAGDKPALFPVARPVHPKNVAERSSYVPLYRKLYDSHLEDTVFVYSPFNPLQPENTSGFYELHFSLVSDGITGDYDIDSSVMRYSEPVFYYVGEGKGSYTPKTPLPAPQRETAGEIQLRFKKGSVRANVNVAGREVNQNLFSDYDNDDNLSSAATVNFSAGQRSREPLSLWINSNYMYRSIQFSNELLSGWEQRQSWNRRDLSDQNKQTQLWETMIGFAPLNSLSLEFGGGHSYIDTVLETEKLQSQADLFLLDDKLSFSHRASLFRHHNSLNRLSHVQNARGSLHLKPASISLHYSDEWHMDTTSQGKGKISYGVNLQFIPINIRQAFTYSHLKSGSAFLQSKDTGYTLQWEQSLKQQILPGWDVSAESRWHRAVNHGKSRSSTFLLSFLSEVYPENSGFSSRQSYRSNQELASRFIQVPVFVGKGRGTHSYDSLRSEYVRDNLGDYYMREQKLYDNTTGDQIRKTTFDTDWFYRPQSETGGLLEDLSFQGVLFMEEHVDARSNSPLSRLPGYLTLFSGENDRWHPDVRYADLSYRQDFFWRPDNHWNGGAYLLSSLRQIRSYREKSIEPGISLERKFNSFLLSAGSKYLFVDREDTSSINIDYLSNTFQLHDVNLELKQSWIPRSSIEFFFRQKGGKAYRTSQSQSENLPSDNNFYYQLTPGFSWKPHGIGQAEISYTYSHVPISGPLDFRIAGGNSSGTTHAISLFANFQTGNNFHISGVYRGELNRSPDEKSFSSPVHVLSLQARVFF
ncbi:hypothetical protein CHISP_1343 [Chitinispirillum alkaliphilum]|nr:hypothetical protein CHISP_1343 [Chitinispirillum alkaliphilum]